MGAQKARNIIGVVRTDQAGNIVADTSYPITHAEIRQLDGERIVIRIDTLPRAELMRVVGMVLPGKRDWRRHSVQQIQDAILTGKLPMTLADGVTWIQDVQPKVQVPAPMTSVTVAAPMDDELDTVTMEPTPATVAAPMAPVAAPMTPVDAGTGSAIEDALTSLMRSVAQDTVNESQVRAIVKDEVGDLVAKAVEGVTAPNVIHFTLPTLETVEVTGHAHALLPKVVQAIHAREGLFLVGPAGSGKSYLVEQAAGTLGLPYYSISCHGQMTASSIWGYSDAHGNYQRTLYREAYENGGVFNLDEGDAGNSNVLASVNGSLAGSSAAFPDGMVKRHADFVCVMTGNTFGTGPNAMFVGRNVLDAATLNRFRRVEVLYDDQLEESIAMGIAPELAGDWLATIRRYRARADEHGLKVVVSPRDTFSCLKLMLAGWTKQECVETVLAGMTPDQRAKIAGSR